MYIITSGNHQLFDKEDSTKQYCIRVEDFYNLNLPNDELVAVMQNDNEFINVSDYELGAYIKYMPMNQARAECDWYVNDDKLNGKYYYINQNTFILPAEYARELLSDDIDIDSVCEVITVIRRPDPTKIIPLSGSQEGELYDLFKDYLESNCRDTKIAADIDFILKEAFK